MAQTPSTFKLLKLAIAKDFAKQVVSHYRLLHGLPVLGVGEVLPPTPKRVKNKAAQKAFRASHQRYSVWKDNVNVNIVTAYEKKLEALRLAKKNYLFAERQLKAALYSYNRANHNNATANLTDLQATVDLRTTEKNTKHDIYIAAQSLTYIGDGTAL